MWVVQPECSVRESCQEPVWIRCLWMLLLHPSISGLAGPALICAWPDCSCMAGLAAASLSNMATWAV